MEGIRTAHRQLHYRVRLEWGREGVAMLARDCAVVVIIDVLSFSTAVDVATGRGARVLPQAWGDRAAAVRAAVTAGATPAGPRDGAAPSLRPSSLRTLAPGTLLALPSPNGATLCTLAAGHAATVLVGCLRNASAVAAAALAAAGGGAIGLVPAGERWPDGTMRVAAEDLLGAGAIAAALGRPAPSAPAATPSRSPRDAPVAGLGPSPRDTPAALRPDGAPETPTSHPHRPSSHPVHPLRTPSKGCEDAARGAKCLSPEAELAVAAFRGAAVGTGLRSVLTACAGGRELVEEGYGEDVALAAQLDASTHAPHLRGGVVYPPVTTGT